MKMIKIVKLSLAILLLPAISFSQAPRNCGTMESLEMLKAQDAHLQDKMDLIEQHTQQFLLKGGSPTTQGLRIIPVVVHVVYEYSSQNITDAQIQSQIDVLNEDFRRLNADKSNTPSYFSSIAADAQIEFCLAVRDPGGQTTDGITRTLTSTSSFTNNDYVKYNSTGGKNAWPSAQYLNLWVCNMSGNTLGYAQFPGGPSATDGVVIDYAYFGRDGSAVYPFDKGRTATHEVGHWLNLRHIWGDAYCGNDYVNDTPTQSSDNAGCPSFPKSSCNNYSDMFMNYMDYTYDACMNLFSTGQKNRMAALFTTGGFRKSLLSSDGCTPVGGPPTYCSSQGNSVADEWIASVEVGTISNTSGANGGYGDFTNISTNVELGSTHSFTLTPGFTSTVYNEYWKIWIDFNGDLDFADAGELAFDAGSLSSAAVSGTITIPASASLGTTRMRVSMKYNGAQTDCEAFTYGEVEDYSINIKAACPVPTNTAVSQITSTTATMSWSSNVILLNYEMRIKTTSSSTWTNFNTTSQSISLTGMAPGTQYEFQVRSKCSSTNMSGYSSSTVFTTLSATTPYCVSKGNSVADEWIAGVKIGSINNTTGANGGYANFTNLNTDLEQGSNYPATLTPGFTSTAYNEYWKIWIDYNTDGDFTDAGELVYDAGAVSNTVVNGSFTVPAAAPLGTTRMRVSMKYNGAQTPCESFSYGEVEDYSVTIVVPVIKITYCTSAGSSTSYEWIAGVSVGTINNTTGSDGGYGDFTNISTDFETGFSYTATLTPGFASSAYNEYWKIWIDFNKDGDFTDAGELVYDPGVLSSKEVLGSFTIPTGIDLGITRMRVSMKYNSAQNSCETFSYGEVEDYHVNIVNNQKVVSTIEEEIPSLDVQLYPNPATVAATIAFAVPEGHETFQIEVYSVTGKMVFNDLIESSKDRIEYELSLDGFSNGVYYVKLTGKKVSVTRKLMVVN